MIILLVGHYYLSNMRWDYILVQSLFMQVISMKQVCNFLFITLIFFLHNAAATARATFEIFPARTT